MERRDFFRNTLGALTSLPFLNLGQVTKQGFGNKVFELGTLTVDYPNNVGPFPYKNCTFMKSYDGAISMTETPHTNTNAGLGNLVVYISFAGVIIYDT